jgi:hypothetical protein
MMGANVDEETVGNPGKNSQQHCIFTILGERNGSKVRPMAWPDLLVDSAYSPENQNFKILLIG